MTKAAMPLGNVCKCSLKMLNGRNIHKLLRQSIVNLCHSEQSSGLPIGSKLSPILFVIISPMKKCSWIGISS